MASTKISFVLAIFCLFIATTVSIIKPNFKLTERIVNGFDANPNQFPYFAALSRENASRCCGGAVISQWHILTAAHCVAKYKNLVSYIKINLGKHLLAKNGVIQAEIEKIIPHPLYKEEFLKNDIALIKTINEIQYSASVQPIALPQSNVDAEGGQRAVLCGFGALYHAPPENRTHPKVLQYQETETFSLANCSSKYSEIYAFNRKNWQLANAMMKNGKKFCALNNLDKTTKSSPCNGDSGGPLVFNNTLIGLISASTGCASGYPDFYENVYEHLDWIRDEMKNNIKKRPKTRKFH